MWIREYLLCEVRSSYSYTCENIVSIWHSSCFCMSFFDFLISLLSPSVRQCSCNTLITVCIMCKTPIQSNAYSTVNVPFLTHSHGPVKERTVGVVSGFMCVPIRRQTGQLPCSDTLSLIPQQMGHRVVG